MSYIHFMLTAQLRSSHHVTNVTAWTFHSARIGCCLLVSLTMNWMN